MANGLPHSVTGTPKFPSAELNSLASNQGDLAAWKELLSRRGFDAVAEVSGDFAVALHDDKGRVFLAVDRFAVCTLC